MRRHRKVIYVVEERQNCVVGLLESVGGLLGMFFGAVAGIFTRIDFDVPNAATREQRQAVEQLIKEEKKRKKGGPYAGRSLLHRRT